MERQPSRQQQVKPVKNSIPVPRASDAHRASITERSKQNVNGSQGIVSKSNILHAASQASVKRSDQAMPGHGIIVRDDEVCGC
jgi:hypothetical protein